MLKELVKEHCTVLSIRYHSPDSGFTVFTVKTESGVVETISGLAGSLHVGQALLLWGEPFTHPKFGPQLKLTRLELPVSGRLDILPFLMSGYIKHVGPEIAQRIHAMFGDSTSEIMDNDPDQLLKVKGIGPRTLCEIVQSWSEHRNKCEADVEFQRHGLGPKTVQKILKRWPNHKQGLAVIRENPYLLAWEIEGVGFYKADEVARLLNIDPKSPFRVRAAMHFALEESATGQGHCYLPESELYAHTNQLLRKDEKNPLLTIEDEAIMREQLDYMALQGLVVLHKTSPDSLVLDRRVFLKNIWNAESELAGHIHRLLMAPPARAIETPVAVVAELERKAGITLHDAQRAAILEVLESNVSVITGGPGTGKTTLVRFVMKVAQERGVKHVMLLSPTGRAAKRLEESTGKPAKTIHRALEYTPGKGFAHDQDEPWEADLVICDESSMLDVFLARSMLAAVPTGARLVFVGDVNQLPSVGAGQVLSDLIAMGTIPVARLSCIYRQSETSSAISTNANAILTGSTDGMNLKAKDFYFWGIVTRRDDKEIPATERAEDIQAKILASIPPLLGRGYVERDIQVLAPMYKGAVGVRELNSKLKDIFNPSGRRFKVGFQDFRVGDRVLQTRNNYDKDVFNGDMGYISEYDEESLVTTVTFDGREVAYASGELDEITLAYAVTVHKAQGSEYPVVIMPCTTSHFVMLANNLFYTAISRAKTFCLLIGERKALNIAVRNLSVSERRTMLIERVKNLAS